MARGGAGYASAAAGEGRQPIEEVSLVGNEVPRYNRSLPSPAAGGLSIAWGKIFVEIFAVKFSLAREKYFGLFPGPASKIACGDDGETPNLSADV